MEDYVVLCQVNDINGETHAQGVHTATGNDPEAPALHEIVPGVPSRPRSRVQAVPQWPCGWRGIDGASG